jgi:small subunit ribosomal protein S4
MGDPKKQRKKYATPRFPWRSDAIQEELKILGQYGLRNKHELWRHETTLSNFRGIARSLIGKSAEERKKMEEELLSRLKKLGVLRETAVLDDVLDLTIEDILERRLQTIVFRKGLSRTIHQTRQLITHGHIAIGNRTVTVPSYIVAKNEEKDIAYAPKSPYSNANHPLRQTIAVAPASGGRSSEESQREEEE